MKVLIFSLVWLLNIDFILKDFTEIILFVFIDVGENQTIGIQALINEMT